VKMLNVRSRFKSLMHNSKGFSLVEIMVAIVILAVGLLGAGKLLSVSAQYQIGYQDQAGTWHDGNVKSLMDRRTTFNSTQTGLKRR
jgi:prepilin-type N-terminal cleavage/methylation domain-containing protein